MNLEETIAQIQWLERLYSFRDTRSPELFDLYTVSGALVLSNGLIARGDGQTPEVELFEDI